MNDELNSWLWSATAAAVIACAAALLFVRTRRRRTIFISYRRSDSRQMVDGLAQALRARFGSAVFRDIESIAAGEGFRTVIARRLHSADVVLVVIGPGWLSARNEQGLRLEQADDTTRLEIEMALASGATTIPLLVAGATMPRESELVRTLRPLAGRNALTVTAAPPDAALAPVLAAVLAAPVQRTPWMVLLAHAAIVTVVLLFSMSGGFLPSQIASLLAIVTPMFLATGTVALIHAFGVGRKRARVAFVPASTLWVPLGLAAVAAALVAMKGSNFAINTFAAFQAGIAIVESLLAVHTGVVLSGLFQNGEDVT